MKKVTLFMALILFCSWQIALAQITIKGTVTDAKDGSTLPGVSILVKGTTVGTSTDLQGGYTISVPAKATTLVFSMIGYNPKEVLIGNQSTVSVTLDQSAGQLKEVVVTALGIKREQKALGYAMSTIEATDITRTGTSNFGSALYGKAPGVRIGTTPGGATSAVNIQIRGTNSITGKNQPLIVVDGIPIRNEEASNNAYFTDQRVRGNGLLDINPEDIEAISILKGASAAALYGSEAVNGVVLITTKTGKGTKGFSVDVSTSHNFDKVAYLPRYQNVRGPGVPLNVSNSGQDAAGFIYYDTNGDGVKETRGILAANNFGPVFDGKPTMCWDGVIRPYESQNSNYAGFFQQGYNSSENIAISNSSDNASIRLSLTRQDNKGISLGSENTKNIANLNTTLRFGKKYSMDILVNYINQHTHNRPYEVDRMINNFTGMIGRFEDASWYLNKYQTSKGYYVVTGAATQSLTPSENIIYNGFKADISDYVWRVYKQISDEYSDRLIGSLTNNWQIVDGLKLRARLATDYTAMKTINKEYCRVPLAFSYSGSFGVSNLNNKIVYGDVLLTYTRKITPDVEVNLMGGYTATKEENETGGVSTNGGLSLENMFDLTSSVSTANSSLTRTSLVKDAFIGTVNGSYKNFFFVEGTLRRDRTSTMNPANNSFIYPSINSSLILNEAFKLPSFITYSKLRGSWGIVGNYPDIYSANILYSQANLSVQAVGGKPVLLTTIPGAFGNNAIRPEQKHEFEFGLETKFFENRFGFDVSYYNAQIVDQILPLTIATSSGGSSVLTNIGTLRNKGIEVAVTGTAFQTKDIKWEITLNWAKNKNVVEKLANNATSLLHTDWDGNAAQLVSVVGHPMGDILVHPVQTDASGNGIVDPNGMYHVDPNKMITAGNAMPKGLGGLLNTFSYKGLSLDVALDYTYGGSLMPTGIYWLVSRGLLEESLNYMDVAHGGISYYQSGTTRVKVDNNVTAGPNGEVIYHDGILFPGVKADGSANTYIASQADYYNSVYNWGGPQYSPNTRYELYVHKNNYLKVREMALSYQLPKTLAEKIRAKNLTLSVFGRNLFYIYRTFKDIDSEQTTAGSRWFQNVNNAGTNPSTRTVGFSLRASF